MGIWAVRALIPLAWTVRWRRRTGPGGENNFAFGVYNKLSDYQTSHPAFVT
jgi:hypothetical protein